jgi:porin
MLRGVHPAVFVLAAAIVAATQPTGVFTQVPTPVERPVGTVASAALSDAPVPPVSADGATAPSAQPAAAPEPREWPGNGLPWSRWTRMTGDWHTLRPVLEARGLRVEGTVVWDGSGRPRDIDPQAAVGRELSSVGVGLDLERAAGLSGVKAFVQIQNQSGGAGATCLSMVQAYSNIDADPFTRVSEAWIEHQHGALRVKAGRFDANSEFAFVENGGDFIQSSMGYTPTIFLFPTFPDPHAGVMARFEPAGHAYASAGVFNIGPVLGLSDFRALLWMGEGGLQWDRGRVGVGYWRSSRRMAAESGPSDLVADGAYLVLDQALWSDGERGRTVNGFLQLGVADGRLSPVGGHVGAGFVASGFVPRRPDDSVGLGVTAIRFGSWADPHPLVAGEVSVAAFYRYQVSGWMAVKPDLQLVIHPDGVPGGTAAVATIRLEFGF